MRILDINGKDITPEDKKKKFKVFPMGKANRQFSQLKPIDKKVVYRVLNAIHKRRNVRFPGF